MRMRPLWTGAEAARATGGASEIEWAAHGLSIDSRTIRSDELFIALRGPNFDGHDFVAEALAKGAAAAMVERRWAGAAGAGPLLVVEDAMEALNSLAVAARTRSGALVVAVTGSVGKTGTKEALRLAFEAQAESHASAGNLNNQWGVPLSLARMPREAAYAVFELAMNRPGELGPLARLVRPHVAIVTTVEAVHLEFFASLAAIADAKAEVFEGLEAGGVAILNADNPYFEQLAQAARRNGADRVMGFGSDARASARLENLALHPDCCCIAAEIGGLPVTYKIGAPGRHWAMNSLAVLAAVHAVGADLGLAALALAQFTPPQGRGRRHRVDLGGEGFVLIDESYNASPAAVRAALATLAGTPVGARGRRIVVLGDMLELGPDAPRAHEELAADITRAGVRLVFTAGANMARLHEALPAELRGARARTSEELVAEVGDAVRAGDVVLVKGSLASRMGLVVEALLALHRDLPARVVNG